ncbi:Aminoacyl-tRNA synthetase, class II [Artemisia annua]|uniref:proline--tRNA ligase n=1 Tax=Artemisia annua TaxID=35608 RepID=A0A2U1MB02_ARTAN|nr:Aminoacyl-tRNA synthetase, class II [Artemisia annua]
MHQNTSRSREFLWQEGHSAFATKEEADIEVDQILELYRRLYEEYLAVPVVKGQKSELEKFAGGLYTTSVEAFIPETGRGVQGATSHCLGQNFAKMFEINFDDKKGEKAMVDQILELYRRLYEEYLAVPVVKGQKSELEKFAGGLYTTSVEAFIPETGRGVQGATSHCLGQNFAKMFEINFDDKKGEKAMVWQNSWGYSTRTIGVMVMVHGDDKGLVLPPKVSEIQVIVIHVPFKDEDVEEIMDACSATVNTLKGLGIRARADPRENYSPGWKYSHWEMKGVPLRIEIGPKDLANNQVRAVCRDNGSKVDLSMADLGEKVNVMLDDIQQRMFDSAKQKRDACIQVTKTWDEFIEALGQKKLILAPWCDEEEVEKDVKAKTKGEAGAAKTLCSPFDQPEMPQGKPAKKWTYWGRSY